MEYTRKIYLDVNASSASTVVKAKQGDILTRYINVVITKDQVPVILNNSIADGAQFRLQKPDGKAVVNSCIIESDGTVTVDLTPQCLAVVGRSVADISIIKNGNSISTVVFILDVVPSPNVMDRVASSDEFGIVQDIISKGESIIDKSEEIDSIIERASDMMTEIEYQSEQIAEMIDIIQNLTPATVAEIESYLS